MVGQKNNEKKPIGTIEHYLNADDDGESSFGTALFRETLGFSIDDLLDSDNSIDDIEETKTIGSDNND